MAVLLSCALEPTEPKQIVLASFEYASRDEEWTPIAHPEETLIATTNKRRRKITNGTS
jgi:hypothetical protein